MARLRVLECGICGYARSSGEDGRSFESECACLTPGCDGESGDECEPILVCSECV